MTKGWGFFPSLIRHQIRPETLEPGGKEDPMPPTRRRALIVEDESVIGLSLETARRPRCRTPSLMSTFWCHGLNLMRREYKRADADQGPVWMIRSYRPIALCASIMYFMHSASLPAFIPALDLSSAALASFCFVGSVILAIISSICFICASVHSLLTPA